VLNPERTPAEAVAKQRRELGSRGAAAQHDQRPSPAEGAIFKRGHIRYYRLAELPTMSTVLQSWDMTFKEAGSSYVCGQTWGQVGANCYLLAQRRDRWGFSATCAQVRGMSVQFPSAHKKLIEAKANGPAVTDVLSRELTGIELVEPEGGKEARANAVEPMWEAGNVWLPHPEEAPWVADFIEELLAFPAAKNDDQVDCMTQALNRLRKNTIAKLRAAMANASNHTRAIRR
jgi:predicted phage terminase large subunit-like protein